MNITIIAAVLLIIMMIGLGVRLLHRMSEKPGHSSSNDALSSGETAVETKNTPDTVITAEIPTSADIPSETESVSYPAESLPDYEVHTLPVTTEEITAEEPETTPEPSETTVIPETTAPSESTEPPESTAEALPSETSTEFSENSDNLPFIGTWILEYDLAPAQETALRARYALPRLPDKPVILRLSVILADDGTLRLICTQEDANDFKAALSDWYAEAAEIYAETGANGIQKAAFLSWAAYRKGLYALLSPDTVNKLNAHWHAEGNTIFITDEGEVQAEISTEFDARGLTVTDFRVTNDDFRDTVSLMQESL
ncbi:MAG: hypothetical protein IK088_06445, partial [Lachnospiraceae bacterium]|nr:hypothetical protein [Lachnospiraceae bacterium]